MKSVILLMLFCISAAAYAGSVYLDCTMPYGEKEILWNVTLDEAAGTASYVIPDLAVTEKYVAVFTSDKVTFGSAGAYPTEFVISRTDLSMTRTMSGTSDTGHCKIASVPNRKF